MNVNFCFRKQEDVIPPSKTRFSLLTMLYKIGKSGRGFELEIFAVAFSEGKAAVFTPIDAV